jgi:pyruvate dehydrogenase E2 component (dihydrolipoamide acetyltransferase)
MATEVTIPQLGESVTEGTITAWLVEVGQEVEADQPLFELSSEKIDTEVPSPVGGVLKEIKVEVDETVDVGTVVAIIDEDGQAAAKTEEPEAEEEQAEEEAEPEAEQEEAGEEAEPEAEQEEAGEEAEPEAEQEEAGEEAEPEADKRGAEGEDGQKTLASPLVRRLVAEHDLDLAQIEGSGKGGRVTREDVEAAAKGKGKGKSKPAAKAKATERAPAKTGERTRTEDLSRIRQRIAAKMMESLQSSAQLTTVQEADVTTIMRLRSRVKDAFAEREGVSLSPFVFMARAAVLAARSHPTVNAKADWEAGKATFHEYVNLGIAVDTDKGLIVPNVKGADDLTLAGLARAINEAAEKARGIRKLEMPDIEGATFTVTNTGSRGVLLDTPILNYPEVAILATGAIQKRPVVVSDPEGGEAIAVRQMVYLCLTYDHRLLDGADAARYVTEVKEILETHDWAAEIGYED